jgi:hypothetical protein
MNYKLAKVGYRKKVVLTKLALRCVRFYGRMISWGDI